MNSKKFIDEIVYLLNEFYKDTGVEVVSIKPHYICYQGDEIQKVHRVEIEYKSTTYSK